MEIESVRILYGMARVLTLGMANGLIGAGPRWAITTRSAISLFFRMDRRLLVSVLLVLGR